MGEWTLQTLLVVYVTTAALFYTYLEATAAPDPSSEPRVGPPRMAH